MLLPTNIVYNVLKLITIHGAFRFMTVKKLPRTGETAMLQQPYCTKM